MFSRSHNRGEQVHIWRKKKCSFNVRAARTPKDKLQCVVVQWDQLSETHSSAFTNSVHICPPLQYCLSKRLAMALIFQSPGKLLKFLEVANKKPPKSAGRTISAVPWVAIPRVSCSGMFSWLKNVDWIQDKTRGAFFPHETLCNAWRPNCRWTVRLCEMIRCLDYSRVAFQQSYDFESVLYCARANREILIRNKRIWP